MKRVNFYLKSRQVGELKLLSRESGASISELIRRSIDEYIAARESKRSAPPSRARGAKEEE